MMKCIFAQLQTFVGSPRLLCNAWFQVFLGGFAAILFTPSSALSINFFSSTIRGKFCGIHLLLFARSFVTAVLSLCSVVAVISKHSRTVFKYNHALVLRVYCHRSSSSLKACIGGHQIFVCKRGFLGTMKSSGPCFVLGLHDFHVVLRSAKKDIGLEWGLMAVF